MRVKLLQDIRDGTGIKVAVNPNRRPAAVAFVRGEVFEVSDATGRKWIERGWAEETEDAPSPRGRVGDAPLRATGRLENAAAGLIQAIAEDDEAVRKGKGRP